MSARAAPSPALHHILLERPDDFAAWRKQARALAEAGVAPEHVLWSLKAEREGNLFAVSSTSHPPPSGLRPVRANKAFLKLAEDALLHRDGARFATLYALLWRLQDDPHLMEKVTDPDIRRLSLLAAQVRHDIHKMRAFVRFRAVSEPDGVDRYVAWFEPLHHIVRANADFFLNRFASQRWSILTPEICLHWDGEKLTEAPGADRKDAPGDDAAEGLWQRYYASIFNPARLKVAMMVKEMPRRYWKNLPEARLIPQLIAGAQARETGMVSAGEDPFPPSAPETLDEIAQGIAACRRCPIGCNGTRAVPGEGPPDARLLIVGEQPGDCEEAAGRPFVGPAGELLDRHLERAGLDRSRIRVTNAVKHFKFQPRGKKRLHQNPTAGEIDRCRWWLNAERQLVKPSLTLALGASAGRALMGRTPNIAQERGAVRELADGGRFLLTAHPAFLLRLDGEARQQEEARFQIDLMRARAALEA